MKYLKMMSLLVLAMVMSNCGSDDPPAPPVVDFFADVNGTEVTFNSSVTGANTLSWNFGDGNTSTEANPIHAYETPGNYTVVLTATGEGGTESESKNVEILESLEYLLTGGAAKAEGKTWKLKYEVAPNHDKEGISFVDNSLALIQVVDEDGLLDWITLSQGYEDSFTFVYDGSYMVDNADGQSLMSLVYALMNHDADIRAISTEPDLVPLADVVYSPKSDATWSTDDANFTVDALNPVTGVPESVEFTGHTRLILDEYLGYKEASILVIIKEISETELTVAIGIHASVDAPDLPVYLFHMTFEAQ